MKTSLRKLTSRYIKELGVQDSHHLLLFIFQFSVIFLFCFWVYRSSFPCACVYAFIYACLHLCSCTSVRRYACGYVCILYLQIPSWHCWNITLIIFLKVLESNNIFFKDVQTILLRSTHYTIKETPLELTHEKQNLNASIVLSLHGMGSWQHVFRYTCFRIKHSEVYQLPEKAYEQIYLNVIDTSLN